MPTDVEFAEFLKRHTDGVLQCGGRRRTIRYVTDRHRGLLIAPLEPVELESDEIVLFIPDEGESSAQVLLTATPIEEGRATDRWLAYHAAPDAPRWCSLRIDAARVFGALVDASIDLICPFADEEPALCKHANADTPALSALCARQGVNDPAPVLVGVDEHGFDVRARTGVVRFDFDEPVSTSAAAADAIERLTHP